MDRTRDPLTTFLRSPVVKQYRAAAQPLAERRLCDLLLTYLNGEPVAAEQWQQFMGNRAPTGTVLVPHLTMLQQQLRDFISDRAEWRRLFGLYWMDRAAEADLILFPVLIADGKNFRMGHQVMFRGVHDICTYAMWLFFDSSRPFGESACLCTNAECGRFFFAESAQRRGRVRRNYCSDECAKSAHRRQIGESVRKHRKRQKLRRQRSKA